MSINDLPLWSAAAATKTMHRCADSMLQKQERLSQQAQRAVCQRADDDWKDYCLSLIRELARLNPTFTSDMVMLAMTKQPHDPRALGPMMKAAQKLGYIVPLEKYERSIRRHATPLRVWSSAIYRGEV
jgi:hypothetical protein